jgi:cellulose synthase/poly-beta-1,6-N-acetylglucosamine synthase-like glycosyltransferase
MTDPAVSVVIPTYNAARFLADAIESALAQTVRDIEVIVVDDGSTDETAEVLARFGDRIRGIRLAHAGVAAARNAGIEVSRAPFIAFLDADDVWAPEKLARQLPVLHADGDVGLVCSDFSIQSPNGATAPSPFPTGRALVNGHVFDELLAGCWVTTSTVVIRRRTLDAIGLFDPTLEVGGEDIHLWLRVAYTWKIMAVPEVLCTKRRRPDGARPFERTYQTLIRARERLLTALPDLSATRQRVVRQQMAELVYQLGRYRMLDGRSREARLDARRALRLDGQFTRAAVLLALSYGPSTLARSLLRAWSRYRTAERPRTDA